MTSSRGILTKRKKWTDLELELLKALYPSTYSATLAKFFSCNLTQLYNQAFKRNLKKSQWYADSPMAQRLRTDCSVGIPTRFKKGQIPKNKGVKGITYPGSIATQFKPGTKPSNHKPVGHTRTDTDGYVYIKMAEGMFQFKLLHRVVWERMNGPVPSGSVVAFINGNKQDCRITNLTLFTKKQNALRNSVHRYGPEIAQLYQLKGAIKRQINKRERQENE